MTRRRQTVKMKVAKSSKAKTFDRLVSDLLCGELTQTLADQIVEMLAENPEFETELLAQVRIHNLLCRYFAEKRARQGIPETESMPKPLDVLVARIGGAREMRNRGSQSAQASTHGSRLHPMKMVVPD